MTNREFYKMVIEGKINDEVKFHAENAIKALDERNAKRKTSKSALKAEAEKMALCEEIVKVLNDRPQTAKEIAEKVGVSAPKVTGLRNKLTEKFGVDIQKIIVDKRVVNGYCVKGE